MKRLMLLVVLGIVAMNLLYASLGARGRTPRPATPWPAAPAPAAPAAARVVPVTFDDPRSPGEDAGALESVDGLPVPIVPGTRVSEAEIRPPKAPRAPRTPFRSSPTPKKAAAPLPPDHRVVAGLLSATQERAVADARRQLGYEVAEWLAPDVPPQWKPPAHLVEAMIVRTSTRPVVKDIVKDFGSVYETTLEVDFSPRRRAPIVAAYQRDLVSHRLAMLGGGLGFVLACLAAVSGYIRADEATKGYYTNWLRLASAAGVGAAGVLTVTVLGNIADARADRVARGVEAKFIPAPSVAAPAPVADDDPKTTGTLKAFLVDMLDGRLDPDLFTAEARKARFPKQVEDLGRRLAPLGEIEAFAPLGAKAEGGKRTLRYRAMLGKTALVVTFTLADDGKVAGLLVRPE
jgi:hypothetical protein